MKQMENVAPPGNIIFHRAPSPILLIFLAQQGGYFVEPQCFHCVYVLRKIPVCIELHRHHHQNGEYDECEKKRGEELKGKLHVCYQRFNEVESTSLL